MIPPLSNPELLVQYPGMKKLVCFLMRHQLVEAFFAERDGYKIIVYSCACRKRVVVEREEL